MRRRRKASGFRPQASGTEEEGLKAVAFLSVVAPEV
jgi:hypothetical protein